MARKPRIEFPGALYHVIARGNHKNRIFLTPKDYQKYLSLIKRYKERYHFQLYAYALMSNHVHLLVEIATVPLSKIMQGLQQTYTQFFNWKYGKAGHLFQGRYKAIICQKNVYLLELIRYIHLNPIRAGVAERLANYPWTSYSYYIKDTSATLIDTDFVLKQFADDKTTARRYYQEFIRAGIIKNHEEFLGEIVEQRILGKDHFVEEMLQRENEARKNEDFVYERLSLKKVLETICRRKGISPVMVKSNSKIEEVVGIRRLFAYVARIHFGYRLKEIASILGIDITTAMKSVRIIADRIRKEKSFEEEVNGILRELETLV
jgi:REP element-mobilizing transposase RayT/ribosomal protein L7Ae-like RNA K-turn-binding protein